MIQKYTCHYLPIRGLYLELYEKGLTEKSWSTCSRQIHFCIDSTSQGETSKYYKQGLSKSEMFLYLIHFVASIGSANRRTIFIIC